MFKVTMSDLGRERATEMQEFTNEPDGDILYSMASKHLLSSGIRFLIHVGDPDEGNYPVSGSVMAGIHRVGDFKIEVVVE